VTTTLHLLSGGAAMGLVRAVEPAFTQSTGAMLAARFGAVGAMKEALLAGDACDVFITTAKMLDELAAAGIVRAASCRALGGVATGIAVRTGDSAPVVDTPEALRAALLAARAIYLPDPDRATAGIHFMRVLAELGIDRAVQPRLRAHPNGAAAMRELAALGPAGAIGCTQVSEILATAGVQLVALLPAPHGLVTVYSAAATSAATAPELAAQFIERLGAPETAPLRRRAGFEESR
jgi:molybdate transport system substrate-binding protein